MKPNRFREVLAAGGMPVGHMIMEFATRGIARMLDNAGVDFALFDMEHSGISLDRVADLLAWCHGTSFAPFVRVPQPDYHFLARVMDAGALGVMVANVQSAEEAQRIVQAVKYAPLGQRGLGLGTAHNNYIAPDPASYLQEANQNTTIICQIESMAGVAASEAIAAVEGVDVLWVGHFDLTSSMGIVGQFGAPAFIDNLKRVVAAARERGKAAGIQPGNLEQAEQWIGLGFNAISWGADLAVYRTALQAAVQDLRARKAQAG